MWDVYAQAGLTRPFDYPRRSARRARHTRTPGAICCGCTVLLACATYARSFTARRHWLFAFYSVASQLDVNAVRCRRLALGYIGCELRVWRYCGDIDRRMVARQMVGCSVCVYVVVHGAVSECAHTCARGCGHPTTAIDGLSALSMAAIGPAANSCVALRDHLAVSSLSLDRMLRACAIDCAASDLRITDSVENNAAGAAWNTC